MRNPTALSLASGAALAPESALQGTFAAMPTQIVGAQASASRTYEAELTVQRKAQDRSAVKAEFEFAIPLSKGVTRSDLESMDSGLKAQIDALTEDQRAAIDQMLGKVDAADGYLLLAASQLETERITDLNAAYARERDAALNVPSRKLSDKALKLAAENHAQRLESLQNQAKDFKLQRFILAKGDMLARSQTLNLGLVRGAAQGVSGTGTTVQVLELAAKP